MIVCLNFIATNVLRHRFNKILDILMYEIWQRINPMGFSAPWTKIKSIKYSQT